MTKFSKRWDGPGIISGFYGDVYVDKDGYITDASFIFPITRSEYVGPVRSGSEEKKVMSIRKFGTGDGQVLGEDKQQPEDEQEAPYRFSEPDENGTPQRLDVQGDDGAKASER
jgi:hypothetical protein